MNDAPRSALAATLRSFRFAARGVVLLLRSQRNAQIHAAITVAVAAIGFWLDLSAMEWCWIVLAIMAVWTAEGLNTAVELLSDAVTREPDPLIGNAKDVAAGAVLIAAVGAAVIGLLVLGRRLIERL